WMAWRVSMDVVVPWAGMDSASWLWMDGAAGRSLDEVGVVGLHARQGAQDLVEVMAHGLLGGIGLARVDGGHDAAVLGDERAHRLDARQREVADPVHVGLEVLDRLPGEHAAGALDEGEMEQLVRTLEGRVVAALGGLLLQVEQVVDA